MKNTFSMFKSKLFMIFKTLFLVIRKPTKSKNRKKAWKNEKYYPINMYIFRLQIIRQTDIQTDGRTDGQTDRQTDGQTEANIPQNLVCGRYKNLLCYRPHGISLKGYALFNNEYFLIH